jgi:hypothetical protein
MPQGIYELKLAVILSLIAGVLIFCEGLIAFLAWWNATYWPHGPSPWLSSFSVSSMIVSGALITVSSVFLYKNPHYHQTFGLIIFLASPLSLLALGILSPRDHVASHMAVAIIIMFIGMIGGALSITHKERQS